MRKGGRVKYRVRLHYVCMYVPRRQSTEFNSLYGIAHYLYLFILSYFYDIIELIVMILVKVW